MKKLIVIGLLIWLGATVALRFFGQFVFRVNPLILLLVSLPLMVLVARAVLRDSEHPALGAIALVAPGMLLDTINTIWFADVFPNIRAEAAPLFGGWILFCNVVVLMTALTIDWPGRRQRA